MTERYAVIGHPVGHSLSPAMQTAALHVAGISATYEPIDVTPETLVSWVTGGAVGLAGFNVTIPHKQAILPLLQRAAPDARATGAVNTVVREGDILLGHNTDVEGFDQALATIGDQRGGDALVLGAGGAARAVVAVLRRRRAQIWIAARTPDAARGLTGDENIVNLADKKVTDLVASVDVLVNATPLGMASFPDRSPLPPGAVPRAGAIAIDLVYGRRTPFLEIAKQAGCRVQDGLEMLVRQGAAAFRIWTGRDPDLDVMRAACLNRLMEGACSVS